MDGSFGYLSVEQNSDGKDVQQPHLVILYHQQQIIHILTLTFTNDVKIKVV